MDRGFFVFGTWLLCATGAPAQAAATAHLTWNPNSEPNIAGYRVYYGLASRTYTHRKDVSGTTAGVSNLTHNRRYFFAVTARNNAGLESMPSNEVSIVTPGAPPIPTPTPGPTATPIPTPISTPTPAPTATPTPSLAAHNFLNVSTRGMVRSGENVLIGGFIISGGAAKKIMVRAIGPSLKRAGVPGAIADPTLELHNSTGGMIASNNNWTSNRQKVVASGLTPTHLRESAVVATLPPGAYTAVLRGLNSAFGVALCELYDLDPAHSQIVNLSTRGRVETGHNVMIGGFIIGGNQSTKVMLRAIGPSLTRHGILGALQDPTLALHNANGSLIFLNNNWRSHQEQQISGSTIPPLDRRESAIVATLKPGKYTAIVRGAGNTSGVALFEVYNLEK